MERFLVYVKVSYFSGLFFKKSLALSHKEQLDEINTFYTEFDMFYFYIEFDIVLFLYRIWHVLADSGY